MADEAADVRDRRDFLTEPSSTLRNVVRYGLSIAVVVACGAGLIVVISRSPPEDETAAETESAVMIDLPPAEASSRPASDAADGPEQQAAPATPAQQTPRPVEPIKPIKDPTPQAEVEKLVKEPPLPVQPNPPAVLEREQQQPTPPPKPVAAPATQAQDERAPAGSQTPAKTDADEGDEGRPAPSAHVITLWQRSLMKRLETAKRQLGHKPLVSGTVKIAFEIDVKGGLAFERIAQSSGSASLDQAALLLVRRAAPFPAPPSHAASRDTSFVVPVRFR